MMVAHKIALDPNNKQRSYFARASGAARFAYNWALGEWKRQYRAGGKPSEVSLRRQLNGLKRQQYPWMSDRDKNAALNLERMAASSAVSARGEARSGAVRKSRVKRASVKREPNSEPELCVA